MDNNVRKTGTEKRGEPSASVESESYHHCGQVRTAILESALHDTAFPALCMFLDLSVTRLNTPESPHIVVLTPLIEYAVSVAGHVMPVVTQRHSSVGQPHLGHI